MNPNISARTLIFLLSSIGLMTLPHVLHVPLPLISFFFLLLGWRFIGIFKPAYLPSQIIVFCLLLSGIGLLIFMHQGVFGRDAGTAVFITALGLKLLEIKSERDLYLITYLAFIVAASQFLYLQNLFMAVYILLVTISLLGTLLCINSGSLGNTASIKKAGSILLQALPLMAVLFIFFPRIEAPRWSFLQDNNQAITGLSDSLEPGSISQLGLSGDIVFRAKFTGKIPENNQRYWRGPVFSYTDGKRWTASRNRRFKHYLDKVTFSGEAYHYKLLMEPQAKNWVFALDMPAAFEFPLHENGVHQLLTSKSFSQRAEYPISSYAQYNTGYITKVEYRENLQLTPQPAERIDELVAQLGGFDDDPEQFIKNLFQHFRENKFQYTLMPPALPNKPIETFLFDTQAGFCGHYATAFTYLMRVAGIPARIVTGYQGGIYNETGKFIEVRQANAHAWSEVWIQGKGWVRYDPTTAIAPERINNDVNIEQQISNNSISFAPIQLDSQTVSLLKSMRSLWSSMDYSWHRWIINYNRRNQLDFLSKLGIHNILSLLYWLIGSIAFISLILAAYLFKKDRIKRDKTQHYYWQACQKLVPLKLIKAQYEGAEDFAKRVDATAPEFKAQFQIITTLYIQLRYGNIKQQKLLIQQLKQAVKQFNPRVL